MQIHQPHSIEAEQAYLGCCLSEGICPAVPPADFYREAHGALSKALIEMSAKGTPIDLVSLHEFLATSKRTEAVGGMVYVSSILEKVPNAGNLEHYGRIISEKATARRAVKVCLQMLQQSERLNGQDVLSWVSDLLAAATQIENGTGGRVEQIGAGLKEVVRELGERIEKSGALLGIPTGLKDLDAVLSGLNPGDLIIIAARPGMGKTALATTIMKNAAMQGVKVLFCSLEMPHKQIIYRFIAQHTGLDLQSLRTGNLSKDEYRRAMQGAQEIFGLPIFIDDSSGISEVEIGHRTRRVKPDLLVVDYLQLVRPARKQDRRDLEISGITYSLKHLAKSMNIPVVLLSQLNRETEKRGSKKPVLADLRDSGAIEQDADLVVLVYREEVYEPKPDNMNLAKLIIAKHRNGRPGTVKATFLKHSTAFKNFGVVY